MIALLDTNVLIGTNYSILFSYDWDFDKLTINRNEQ